MYLADTLSRAPLPEVDPHRNRLRPEHEEVCLVELEKVNAAEFLRVSKDGLRNIQRLTEPDEQMTSNSSKRMTRDEARCRTENC